MNHKEHRLHYMHWSEVVRIGKKAYEELPHLIQPSSSDVALAELYAYYELNELKKQSLWFRLKKFILGIFIGIVITIITIWWLITFIINHSWA